MFYQVGMALSEIKKREFYLADGFENFADFADSIGYSPRHVNQLIQNAKTVNDLPEDLRGLVLNDRTARELSKVPKIVREAVIEIASKGGKKKMTAAAVKKAAPPPKKKHVEKEPEASGKPTPPPPSKAAKAEPEPQEATSIEDETGVVVPKETIANWNEACGMDAEGIDIDGLQTPRSFSPATLLSMLQFVSASIKKAQGNIRQFPAFKLINFSSTTAALSQACADLELAVPYAVCPSCNGKKPKTCEPCRGRGYVSEFYWKNAIPEETRKLRAAL